mmetsp:Transcript_8920/g.19630  ORF Transcript_8920/g.19630 Transcript_8920/m.19630 type:complete len:518 (-) Transcript_8920:112-1665(-)
MQTLFFTLGTWTNETTVFVEDVPNSDTVPTFTERKSSETECIYKNDYYHSTTVFQTITVELYPMNEILEPAFLSIFNTLTDQILTEKMTLMLPSSSKITVATINAVQVLDFSLPSLKLNVDKEAVLIGDCTEKNITKHIDLGKLCNTILRNDDFAAMLLGIIRNFSSDFDYMKKIEEIVIMKGRGQTADHNYEDLFLKSVNTDAPPLERSSIRQFLTVFFGAVGIALMLGIGIILFIRDRNPATDSKLNKSVARNYVENQSTRSQKQTKRVTRVRSNAISFSESRGISQDPSMALNYSEKGENYNSRMHLRVKDKKKIPKSTLRNLDRLIDVNDRSTFKPSSVDKKKVISKDSDPNASLFQDSTGISQQQSPNSSIAASEVPDTTQSSVTSSQKSNDESKSILSLPVASFPLASGSVVEKDYVLDPTDKSVGSSLHGRNDSKGCDKQSHTKGKRASDKDDTGTSSKRKILSKKEDALTTGEDLLSSVQNLLVHAPSLLTSKYLSASNQNCGSSQCMD